jgi:hypothetical protein
MEPEADARNRRRQVGELAPVERQALDPADVDDAADGGGTGLAVRPALSADMRLVRGWIGP